MSFTTRDRETLAKLLGLVGSDHDGEALSAARKAHEMVRARGLTWQDVLLVRPAASQAPPSGWQRPGEPPHVAQATELLRRGRGILTKWEHQFLLSILSYRDLKPRQEESLALIRRKVTAASTAAA